MRLVDAPPVTPWKGRATADKASRQARLAYSEHRERGGRPHAPSIGDGMVLTARDVDVLTHLARLGVLTQSLLQAHLFGGSYEVTKRRLRMMREAGLVHTDEGTSWAGRCWWITRRGLSLRPVRDALPIQLTPPKAPVGEGLLHRIAVADYVLRYERQGYPVLTNREIRTAETGPQDRADRLAEHLTQTGIPLRSVTNGAGRRCWFTAPTDYQGTLHVPSAALATSTGLWAVEVELALKGTRRLTPILRSYKRRDVYQGALYHGTPQVLSALRGGSVNGTWQPGLLAVEGMLPHAPWEHLTQPQRDASPVQTAPITLGDERTKGRLEQAMQRGY